MAIWITGLPASGKSTIAGLVQNHLKSKNIPVVVLDGDEIRKTVSKDLGFSPEDRREHNRRVIEIAKMLGLQSPYEEPTNPEIILDTEKSTPQECLRIIAKKLEGLACL